MEGGIKWKLLVKNIQKNKKLTRKRILIECLVTKNTLGSILRK